MNMAWQFYLEAVGWVENHPHRTIWLGVAAQIVTVVVALIV
jgi:hypothetical protein